MILDYTRANVTQIYAERDMSLAMWLAKGSAGGKVWEQPWSVCNCGAMCEMDGWVNPQSGKRQQINQHETKCGL